MKKIAAALLCAVMCLTAFTGCSKAELGYLGMCKSMMTAMESCRIKGQTEVTMDFDVLKAFTAAIENEVGSTGAAESMSGLTGSHTVLLDYTMQMDMGQMEYNLDMDMTYNGKKYALGEMYFGMAEGMGVSSETLLGLYTLAKDMTDGADGSYFFKADFEKALRDSIGGQYISLYTMEELGVTPEDMGKMVPENGFGKLYDAAFQFYEDLLKGFESGETLVKEISGGYEIDVDGKTVGRLLANVLDFFAENPGQMLDAAESYMAEVAKQTNGADAEEEIHALFAQLRSNTEEISETLREVSAMWRETLQNRAVQLALGSFRYSLRMTQSGGSFVSEDKYEVVYNGKKALVISSKATCGKAKASVVFPKYGMTIEEAGEKVDMLVRRFNPAVGAAVTWGFEDTATKAMLEVRRQQATPFDIGGGSTLEDLVVREGRAYVPLRAICDTLGENVTWNKAERKAYIAKDGKNIAMEGILEGGKSFVGVREFEKIGYTVSFRSVDGLKEAVITR